MLLGANYGYNANKRKRGDYSRTRLSVLLQGCFKYRRGPPSASNFGYQTATGEVNSRMWTHRTPSSLWMMSMSRPSPTSMCRSAAPVKASVNSS
jgi:hypothetical protein